MFAQEYDADAAIRVQPKGQAFQFLVPPRLQPHFQSHEFEAYTQRLVSRLVRRAATFVDVGAHTGFYSLLAAQHNPTVRVLACEPIPETADILERNVRENCPGRVTVHRCAISATTGPATIYRSAASDNCSFCPHPNAAPIGSEEVVTRTIDSLLDDMEPGPLLVKIDTDGHELDVLAGMSATFERFADLGLIVEFNPKMLRAAGHEPGALLRRLDDLGLAVFLLDDDQGQAYRLDGSTDWTALLDASGYANLYCRPRPLALHVVLFSHTAAMAGAERSLLELARELIDDYWCLVSAVCPGEGPLLEKLTAIGAATLSADYVWWCGAGGHPAAPGERLVHDLRSLQAQLTPALRRIDPDVIWTQTLTIPWGALAALELGKPHVWSVCEYGEQAHGLTFPMPRAEILRTIESWSDYIFTNSRALLHDLFPDLPPEHGDHLYRHIPISRPVASSGERLWRLEGATRLALLGTLQPGKGQIVALHAVQQLVHDGLAVELLLAGYATPESLDDLQTLVGELGIGDRVRHVGYLADPYPVLAAADIVLVCSQSEGFCRVAVEGMLLGRAVVYPHTAGLADYMIDGQTGLAYNPPGDHHALAGRTAELIRDPQRRAGLGQMASAYAEQMFSPAAYGGKAYQTLKRLQEQGKTSQPAAASTPLLPQLAQVALFGKLSAELRSDLQAERSALAEQRRAMARALHQQVRQLGAHRNRQMLFWRAGRTATTAVAAEAVSTRLALALCKWRLRFELSADVFDRHWPDFQTLFLSGLFDEAFYQAANPEVQTISSLWHYLTQGGFEGRDPNPLFDSDWYLEVNPDVAGVGCNPLVHYVRFGAAERRSPHLCFDAPRYLGSYPDVAASGLDALTHFLHHGWREGRAFGPG